MDFLAFNRQIFILLWILPTPDHEPKFKKLRNFSIGLISVVFLIWLFIFSANFAYKFLSIDLELSLCALFQVVAAGSQVYLKIIMFFSRRDLLNLFQRLQETHASAYKDYEKFNFMKQADKRASFFPAFLIKCIAAYWTVSCLSLGIFSLIFSLVKYDSVDSMFLYVPYQLILPWNQQCYSGWILELLFSIAAGVSYVFMNNSMLSFYIGICIYHQAYCKNIRSLLDRLNDKKHCSRREANQLLIDTIKSHNSTKEIFQQSANVYSLWILVLLVCSVIFLACNIFQFDLASKHLGAGIFVALIAGFSGAANLYLYCYFGQLAHQSYFDLSEDFYNTNWIILSNDLQKHFILLIANAQIPIYYHGFGVAYLNSNTFLRMIRTVLSYYMSFKTLTS